MKKFIIPLVYISEWVLLFYTVLFVFIFHMIYFANMVFIDMPWEEPIPLTSSVITSLLAVCGIGIICYLYIRYLPGNRTYRKFKEIMWGMLVVLNLVGCALWLSISYVLGLTNDERMVLVLAILVSVILIIQIIRKYRNEYTHNEH